MKILIVAKDNKPFGISPFIKDHIKSLQSKKIHVDVLSVEGSHVFDYIRHAAKVNRFLKKNKVDLIHAFFVYSGMTAIFQKKVPVLITFIGSDFNRRELRILSKISICQKAEKCIFVSDQMASLYKNDTKKKVICFGIDFNRFYPMEKNIARKYLGWKPGKKIILFASTFHRPEKNARLAFDAMSELNDSSIELVEFKKEYKPEEINFLYNASDLLLMTSRFEGSPQVVKEAMACNLPIVSTDVGDVKQVVGKCDGAFITSNNSHDVADKIRNALTCGENLKLRERIVSLKLDLESITEKIINVYLQVLS